MRRVCLLLAALLFCVPLHAAPRWHWFKDKKFWLSVALVAGSVVADVETTEAARGRGAREGNPVYGAHPTRLRAYATGFAMETPVLAGLYLSRKDKLNNYWLPIMLIGSVPHIGAALWNTHVCQPSCH